DNLFILMECFYKKIADEDFITKYRDVSSLFVAVTFLLYLLICKTLRDKYKMDLIPILSLRVVYFISALFEAPPRCGFIPVVSIGLQMKQISMFVEAPFITWCLLSIYSSFSIIRVNQIVLIVSSCAISLWQAINVINVKLDYSSTAYYLPVLISFTNEIINIGLVSYAFLKCFGDRSLLLILSFRLLLESPIYHYEGLSLMYPDLYAIEPQIMLLGDVSFLIFAFLAFIVVKYYNYNVQ
ncbi:hypothetical protein PFISCL1PPCAC_14799, partial [Pristionchus fissidentatus]